MVSKGKTKIKFFQSLMRIFHQFIAYLCFFLPVLYSIGCIFNLSGCLKGFQAA